MDMDIDIDNTIILYILYKSKLNIQHVKYNTIQNVKGIFL
jgi:hypothetical protein